MVKEIFFIRTMDSFNGKRRDSHHRGFRSEVFDAVSKQTSKSFEKTRAALSHERVDLT